MKPRLVAPLLIFLATLPTFLAAAEPARLAREVLTEEVIAGETVPVGGTSITAAGPWAFVINSPLCTIFIYKLDYTSMRYSYDQALAAPRVASCALGRFGTVASASGDVLMIGAPGSILTSQPPLRLDNSGAFYLYAVDDQGIWAPKGLVGVVGRLGRRYPPQPQQDQEFGSAVSISRIAPDDDKYLLVGGAPTYDSGTNAVAQDNYLPDCKNQTPLAAGCDVGLVALYSYDLSEDTETNNGVELLGYVEGTEPGQNLGFAVTAGNPYALAGAPGTDSSPGKLLIIDKREAQTNGDGFDNLVWLAGDANTDQLGQEVSLSGTLVLGSSKSNARSWRIDETGGTRNYVLQPSIYASNGGDVSGSQPAAIGVIPSGATIYRDPLSDDPATGSDTGDAVLLDVKQDLRDGNVGNTSDDDLADLGLDIRLTREALWFANEAAQRAVYYQYPCGFGQRLVNRKYSLISIPCDLPQGTTYGELFGGTINGANVTIGDRSLIRLYRYDRSQTNPDRTFTEVVTDGVIPDDVLRNSFLVIYADRRYFAIPDGLGSSNGTPSFLGIDSDPNGRGAAVNADDAKFTAVANAGLGANVRRFAPVELKPANTDVSDKPFVMVSNLYPRAFDVNNLVIEVIDPPSGVDVVELFRNQGLNPAEGTVYVYDPQALASNPYLPITATGTPGFDQRIAPYQGFYVQLKEFIASEQGAEVILYIPQEE